MATACHKYLKGALKIVLVGDSEVGKTWLLSRSHELYATFSDGYSFLKTPFVPSEVHSPTVFESYITNVDTELLGNYQTNIWDTGGRCVFQSVRPLAYIGADVFMLCFDVTNRQSFYNITESWLPEVQSFQPNIPALLVGTKCDLRTSNESESCHLVSVSEAEAVAHRIGFQYYETSAKTGEHVAQAFESAVKIGHTNKEKAAGQKRTKSKFAYWNSASPPPISSPPQFTADPSTYASDFRKALEDVANADVLFKFEDGSQSIPAHKIVLWFGLSGLRDVLCEKDWNTCEKFKDSFEVKETSFQERTSVILKNWVSRETFIKIVEFLYTGEAGISKDSEYGEINELLTAAKKLGVGKLVDICEYFLKIKDDLNHTEEKIIETSLQPIPAVVNDLFLDKDMAVFFDVTFLVEDTLVFAHKAVLAARSPVFAALLSDKFTDGKGSQIPLHGVDSRSFLAVLEYLYTDHCPSLEKIPVENVLVLADRLCLSRLVQICEIQMYKGLQKMTQKDLLDVLAFSKTFNAKQLTQWCLYVIGLNFLSFQGTGGDLDSVVSEHSQFFEKHCWPSQDYLKALKKYKQRAKQNRKNRRQLNWKASSCLPHNCHIM